MRLLAESGRKSQFHFFAWKVPRFANGVCTPDGNRRRRGRRSRRSGRSKRRRREEGTGERMWLTHGQIGAFAGLLHPETRRQKRITGTKVKPYTAPASCPPSTGSPNVQALSFRSKRHDLSSSPLSAFSRFVVKRCASAQASKQACTYTTCNCKLQLIDRQIGRNEEIKKQGGNT